MLETRDVQLLRHALIRYEQLINRPYLHELSCLNLSTCVSNPSEIQLLQISPFPTSTTPEYFTNILNALHGLDQVIGLIVCSNENGYGLYIGIRDQDSDTDHTPYSLALLIAGLKQVFKKITITPVENSSSFLAQLFNPENIPLLAQAICIPPPSSEFSANKSSLMTRFLELMGTSSPYTLFFLAQPISKHYLYGLLDEYYELSQTLSHFSQTARTISYNLAKNTSKTTIHGDTQADSCNNTVNKGTNTSCNQGGYTNITGSAPITYCDDRTINLSILQNFAHATTTADNCSNSDGTSHTCTNSYSESYLSATNKSDNESIGFSVQNRYVMNAIDAINTQITRIQTLINTSCFAFNSYFFSPCGEASLLAAYNFAGLCQSLQNTSTFSAVNYWCNTNTSFYKLFDQLQHFQMPTFCLDQKEILSSLLIESTEFNSCFFK